MRGQEITNNRMNGENGKEWELGVGRRYRWNERRVGLMAY